MPVNIASLFAFGVGISRCEIIRKSVAVRYLSNGFFDAKFFVRMNSTHGPREEQ